MLSAGVAAFGRWVGLDRDRAFYPTVLIVVASYYVLFAAVGGTTRTVLIELIPTAAFVVAAVAGFKLNPWIVVAGLIGHGVFDALHGLLIHNPGLPLWWPAFCMAYDVGAGIWLTLLSVTPRLRLRAY
jgi:hypothetical protein